MPLAGGWIALLSLLTFAARVKAGAWWKNTVVYMALSVVGRLCGAVTRNLPLFLRAVLVFACQVGGSACRHASYRKQHGSGLAVCKSRRVCMHLLGSFTDEASRRGRRTPAEGDMEHPVDTTHMYRDLKEHGEHLNSIQTGMARRLPRA